jgi:hypothetical protein
LSSFYTTYLVLFVTEGESERVLVTLTVTDFVKGRVVGILDLVRVKVVERDIHEEGVNVARKVGVLVNGRVVGIPDLVIEDDTDLVFN